MPYYEPRGLAAGGKRCFLDVRPKVCLQPPNEYGDALDYFANGPTHINCWRIFAVYKCFNFWIRLTLPASSSEGNRPRPKPCGNSTHSRSGIRKACMKAGKLQGIAEVCNSNCTHGSLQPCKTFAQLPQSEVMSINFTELMDNIRK